ncbi:FAD-dependent oxidoreductase [Amycolatopsis jiangsuensis]|uniref:long-chain-alcohol oxidase n=1 Tax=Amycolatopsis jiangsuensis TaxID=1181879 RepID=A0A840IRT9_9PSEU|nr:GMC family oxidoreductase [Amycolatopsis jiangsuensis]MBB4683878.1 choline dehydrogenase-like flavoprotein [Amycolatopsis jiangsuensis]
MSEPQGPDTTKTLSAVCDAFLPSLPPPDAAGAALAQFYRDGALVRGIEHTVRAGLAGLTANLRDAVRAVLEHLTAQGFAGLGLDERVRALATAAEHSAVLRLGVRQLRAMTFGTFVGAVDEQGRNPVWPVIGYPGPPALEIARAPGRITVTALDGELAADVCVIGSGAGGAVIAARAAQAGLSVVIVEAGPRRDETDFDQIDSHAGEMFLRGGALYSDSGSVGVLAGSVLGGGTLINSMVCLRTPAAIREQWAAEGLSGLDGPEFDQYTDLVWEALGVTTDATVHNANTRAMITGLAALGYAHHALPRNAKLTDEPAYCGFCNAGCRSGNKSSVLHTYLQSAVDAGARIVTDCTVDRISTHEGHASGVLATRGGKPVRIAARTVVVAAGGVESPAVLLRSGIGGPAVGKNLRLHPAWIVTGVYDQPVEAWSGQIQSAVSFDLAHCEDGTGFLVESLTLNPLTWAGQTPFRGPAEHRRTLRDLPCFATWHGVAHDHGSGEVYLDREGRAAIRWDLDDEYDLRVARRAHTELARMHRAAGAREIFTFHWNDHSWRRGEDFDAYLARLAHAPAAEHTAFSAHQMGSCRLGADPSASVADGRGQLHDIAGVWIGDASALPTAPGVNPMITVMALAERTAAALVASVRAPAPSVGG